MKFLDRAVGSPLPAEVEDGRSLVLVEVGMAHQLLEGGGVDVESGDGLRVRDGHAGGDAPIDAVLQAIDLAQLLLVDKTAQETAVADNATGKDRPDAGELLEVEGVGGVEVYRPRGFAGVASLDTLLSQRS